MFLNVSYNLNVICCCTQLIAKYNNSIALGSQSCLNDNTVPAWEGTAICLFNVLTSPPPPRSNVVKNIEANLGNLPRNDVRDCKRMYHNLI